MRKLAMLFLLAVVLGVGYAAPVRAEPPDPCFEPPNPCFEDF